MVQVTISTVAFLFHKQHLLFPTPGEVKFTSIELKEQKPIHVQATTPKTKKHNKVLLIKSLPGMHEGLNMAHVIK
jgi:hypothetical protein